MGLLEEWNVRVSRVMRVRRRKEVRNREGGIGVLWEKVWREWWGMEDGKGGGSRKERRRMRK